jgi:hypothetical protein
VFCVTRVISNFCQVLTREEAMNYRYVLLVSCCVLVKNTAISSQVCRIPLLIILFCSVQIIFEIIVAWPALIHGCPREGFGSEMDCMESHTLVLNEAPAYCKTMPECFMLCWILPETIIACILLFVFASKWRWIVYTYVVAFWIIPVGASYGPPCLNLDRKTC